MRKVMVVQHVAHEPLGTLLPMLKAAGLRIRHVNFGRHPELEPKLESYNGLIVLGGPMGVYEADRYSHLKTEMRLIEAALKKNIPVLGLCLGAQLIAHVLGGAVRKAPEWELGWYPLKLTAHGEKDPLLKDFKSGERVFQMHQDMFETPKDAIHLAATELVPGQAIRYGEKVYGLQFHLEADQAMIRRWLHRPEHQANLKASQGKFEQAGIEAETARYIERSLALSQSAFAQFISLFNLPERPELLGSR